eukprot:TRINITY_DN12364_c1_g11_i1.p1 TRINITY_DN12364_c1_g11~~TRINITY_DN12364_c1_g11_i1.p1  ORF type:complete len:358 (+),score=50.53 TRINITY_DN12364_c1_g11_i1:498-1571(+)
MMAQDDNQPWRIQLPEHLRRAIAGQSPANSLDAIDLATDSAAKREKREERHTPTTTASIPVFQTASWSNSQSIGLNTHGDTRQQPMQLNQHQQDGESDQSSATSTSSSSNSSNTSSSTSEDGHDGQQFTRKRPTTVRSISSSLSSLPVTTSARRPLTATADSSQPKFALHREIRRRDPVRLGAGNDNDALSSAIETKARAVLNGSASPSRRAGRFVCPVCDNTYAQKAHMIRHLRSHLASYDYACDKCGKAFYRRDQLVAHLRSHETDQEEHICQIKGCGLRFESALELNSHLVSHHQIDSNTLVSPHACRFCSYQSSSLFAVVKHESTHLRLGNTPLQHLPSVAVQEAADIPQPPT